jgi:hypothetical protein
MEEEQPTRKNNVKFWAGILLLAALILFIVAGYPLVKQIALDGFGLEATGVVVGVSGAVRIQTPIVQFTAADGKQYTFRSYYGNGNIRFTEGEEVEIQYLAIYPRIAEVNLLGWVEYPSNIQATCLGMFLLMGGLVALRNKPLVLDFRRRKNES